MPQYTHGHRFLCQRRTNVGGFPNAFGKPALEIVPAEFSSSLSREQRDFWLTGPLGHPGTQDGDFARSDGPVGRASRDIPQISRENSVADLRELVFRRDFVPAWLAGGLRVRGSETSNAAGPTLTALEAPKTLETLEGEDCSVFRKEECIAKGLPPPEVVGRRGAFDEFTESFQEVSKMFPSAGNIQIVSTKCPISTTRSMRNVSEDPVVEHKGIAGQACNFSRLSFVCSVRWRARQIPGTARHSPGGTVQQPGGPGWQS